MGLHSNIAAIEDDAVECYLLVDQMNESTRGKDIRIVSAERHSGKGFEFYVSRGTLEKFHAEIGNYLKAGRTYGG